MSYKITLAAHVRMILSQALLTVGLLLVGAILALTFIKTDGLLDTALAWWGWK